MAKLGIEAQRHGDVIYYGFSGDALSGSCQLENVRNYSNIDSLVLDNFFANYEYHSEPQIVLRIFGEKCLFEDVLERYAHTFRNYRDLMPYDAYLMQRIKERNFRRIGYFASGSKIGLTPVSPFHDKRVWKAYLQLPWNFIQHQKIHCMLGYSAKRPLMWIPANSWHVPLFLEPVLLSPVRRIGKKAIPWLGHIVYYLQHSPSSHVAMGRGSIEHQYAETFALCEYTGLFDLDALKTFMGSRIEDARTLAFNLRALRILRFARGDLVDEIDGARLFRRDYHLRHIEPTVLAGEPNRALLASKE